MPVDRKAPSPRSSGKDATDMPKGCGAVMVSLLITRGPLDLCKDVPWPSCTDLRAQRLNEENENEDRWYRSSEFVFISATLPPQHFAIGSYFRAYQELGTHQESIESGFQSIVKYPLLCEDHAAREYVYHDSR